MKSTFFLAAATIIFSAAQAQDTSSTTGTTGTTATDTTKKLNAYGSYSTRDSIAAKYKLLPMPAPLTVEKTFPILGSYQLNTAPVDGASTTSGTNLNSTTTTGTTTTGTTTTTTTDAGTTGTSAYGATDATAVPNVTVMLDSVNKGIVWVEGLPEGRMKAYLKKSPATYRIIAQKTASGTSVPEGTLHFDPQTGIMHVVLGAPFNEADPIGVFALSAGTTPEDNTAEVKVKTKNTKTKSKLKFYTASKVVPVDQQQQQNNTNGFQNGLQQAQQTGSGNQ